LIKGRADRFLPPFDLSALGLALHGDWPVLFFRE